MASSTGDLKWEWPAGRAIGTQLLVQVEAIQPVSRALFGIKASPSMADALPDATEVRVIVDEQGTTWRGRRLRVELPGIEARKLQAGAWAAFGLIESDTVCACVAPSDAVTADEARRWLPQAPCR